MSIAGSRSGGASGPGGADWLADAAGEPVGLEDTVAPPPDGATVVHEATDGTPVSSAMANAPCAVRRRSMGAKLPKPDRSRCGRLESVDEPGRVVVRALPT
ncbi:hypothetical protein CTKZ_31050 [Cellulomonas algicola]|uniref:Uncharacterized protein n=1 Tax=Cellulomonas algicola TaxID=2071633 RepID=A0A401V3P8_9CELL|nr:hypothetical protein CTKZ_31050 [Cellulomonas algicola]